MNPVVNAIANRLSLRHRRSLRLTSTNCSCEPGQFKSAALDGIFVRDNPVYHVSWTITSFIIHYRNWQAEVNPNLPDPDSCPLLPF